jgi:endonuclease/exonuclease/phosphatase family metal-dependent hydrolase
MRLLLALLFAASACAPTDVTPDDEPGDLQDATFAGKGDGAECVDADGPIGDGVLELVNDPSVSAEELDAPTQSGGAGLYRSAAYGIVDARPIADLAALDAVPWVGPTACAALAAYACNVADRCHRELNAMTWNLEHFPLSAETEDAVVEVFQQTTPDVVGLQEIEDIDAFERVMERLPEYDGFLAEPGPYNGVALVVKRSALEVLGLEDLFVDDWYPFPRPVIVARLQVPDGEAFEVAVVHLKASGGEANKARRRAAASHLRAWLDARRSAGAGAALVVGDWNDELGEPAGDDDVFAELREPDARASFLTWELEQDGAITYVPWRRMLDHVLATDELLDAMPHQETRVLALDETWRDDYVETVSDHRPVLTTLTATIRY